jgi:hypothetical protein
MEMHAAVVAESRHLFFCVDGKSRMLAMAPDLNWLCIRSALRNLRSATRLVTVSRRCNGLHA